MASQDIFSFSSNHKKDSYYDTLSFSMLFSDFASAAVLITFGVVLGKTTPLQLIILALIEIVLFTVNEIIGRKYLRV